MISVSFKLKELPELKLPREVLLQVGKVVEGNILDNIATQRQASGAALKQNQLKTRELKRRRGFMFQGLVLALVSELHRFVQGGGRSWRSEVDVKKQTVTIKPATAELAMLSRSVQLRGYVGWLAISKQGAEAIRQVLRNWIKKMFEDRAKGNG